MTETESKIVAYVRAHDRSKFSKIFEHIFGKLPNFDNGGQQRELDRALQSLKKRGVLRFVRSTTSGWSLA